MTNYTPQIREKQVNTLQMQELHKLDPCDWYYNRGSPIFSRNQWICFGKPQSLQTQLFLVSKQLLRQHVNTPFEFCSKQTRKAKSYINKKKMTEAGIETEISKL